MRKNNTNHVRMGSESAEQQALFQWANYSLGKYPALEWMYHVPRGETIRGNGQAAKG